MLVFLLSLDWGRRMVMFQVSVFYFRSSIFGTFGPTYEPEGMIWQPRLRPKIIKHTGTVGASMIARIMVPYSW